MPVLRDRLKTFHNYATADLAGLYGDQKLDTSLQFEAHDLASVALLNGGDGSFVSKPLPTKAQMSPGHGVLLSDFDADGKVDCIMAQNFYGAQPEIGWHDAGLSVLLRGNGDGTFTAVDPSDSGLMIRPAVMAATLIDLNSDGRPDLAFATNGGGAFLFSEPGAARAENRVLEVRLADKGGNRRAFGARVSAKIGEISQTAEIAAGSGYLGQSEPALWFGLGKAKTLAPVAIQVRWPDGEITEHEAAAGSRSVTLRR